MTYEQAVEKVRTCKSFDEALEKLDLASCSPEAWYANIVWDALKEKTK